jgi:7-dehydrocholesterol reductase
MVAWTVVNLSFAAHQWATLGRLTNSMVLVNALQLIYVLDLVWREAWYLRTIDIQHDRFGFYLAWGSLVWIPFVYTLPAAYLAVHPVDLSTPAALGVLALGLAGYAVFLSANAQRDGFRRADGPCRVWRREAVAIPARFVTADGRVHDTRLLASGWWGLARHANYAGDLMMATAFGLACGVQHVLPYLYAIYLTGLLVHRVHRDERRCRAKYGAAWDAYCARVPYRMIPFVW